MTSPGIYKF